jgi:hypothetical protein
VSSIRWTIDTKTNRGVLVGAAKLTNAAGLIYSGTLTLITQGAPAAGANVPGRGWLSAAIKLPDEGNTAGDDTLLANAEFEITSVAPTASSVTGRARSTFPTSRR